MRGQKEGTNTNEISAMHQTPYVTIWIIVIIIVSYITELLTIFLLYSTLYMLSHLHLPATL